MKTIKILVAALSAGTLFAQAPAPDLDARIQIMGEFIRPLALTVAPGVKDQAGTSAGFGVRFMGEIGSARNWYYEIGGKLDSSSKLTLNDPTVNANLTDIKITHSYWALGAGYLIPMGPMSLGLHLEGRGEALAAQGTQFQYNGTVVGTVDAGTTYLRPWGRLTLDGTFRIGSTRPYVGLEVAATPIKTSQNQLVALTNMDDRTLKSMAPSTSAAIYLGMHF